MSALRAAREVDPPDWLIAAGAIRTAVWDFLHGYAPTVPPVFAGSLPPPAPQAPGPPPPVPPSAASPPVASSAAVPPSTLADVDLGFFDPTDLSPERDEAVEAALRAVAPEFPWEAKNQAAVHLWYPRRFGLAVEPFRSSAEAVATFPETATSVALRLDGNDRLTVVAPCGLDDLLGLVHRHNPRRAPAAVYEERLASKRITERWPRVTVIPAATPGSRGSRRPPATSQPR
jgi:uncharacterized protein